MLFSTATAYALQALAVLPENGRYRLAKAIASKLDLPGPYMSKILQSLTQAGILESARGPNGGFRLAMLAKEVTVGMVLDAMEGPEAWEGCVMGFPGCDHARPCPLHEKWSRCKGKLMLTLAKTTIRDLQGIKPRKRRKAPGRAVR